MVSNDENEVLRADKHHAAVRYRKKQFEITPTNVTMQKWVSFRPEYPQTLWEDHRISV